MEFTEEQKKILKSFAKLVLSYGVDSLEFSSEYGDSYDPYPTISDLDINSGVFSRNESLPSEVEEMFDDVLSFAYESLPDNETFDNIDGEYDFILFNLIFNPKSKEITVDFQAQLTVKSEDQGMYYELDDYPELKELFDSAMEKNPELKKYTELKVEFDGSGDSGQIYDNFTNNVEVPDEITEYLYDILNGNYGGWENNEGSSGFFQINLKEYWINFAFFYNNNETEGDEIVKVSFE